MQRLRQAAFRAKQGDVDQGQATREAEVAAARAVVASFEAAAAKTRERKAAAIEATKAAIAEAAAGARNIENGKAAGAILEKLASARERIGKEEQKALDEAAKKETARKNKIEENIQKQKDQKAAIIESFKVLEDDKDVKLNLAIEEAEKRIKKIQDELDKVKEKSEIKVKLIAPSKITIDVNQSGGSGGDGAFGDGVGFFRGGPVVGRRGIDNIPARLTAGEFVVDRQGSNLADALRFFASKNFKLPTLPAGTTQKLNTGGPVNPVAEQTVNLTINMGSRKASIRTNRQGANELVDLLSQFQDVS